MTYYAIELAAWTLGLYFAGCIIGSVLRGVFPSLHHRP